jgi:hypothetical protein
MEGTVEATSADPIPPIEEPEPPIHEPGAHEPGAR